MASFNKENGANFKKVRFPVATGKGDDKKTKDVEAEVPASLADAVKAEGEKKVFRRYVQSLVIEMQGEHRNALKDKTPGERKRAPYMEELGI